MCQIALVIRQHICVMSIDFSVDGKSGILVAYLFSLSFHANFW